MFQKVSRGLNLAFRMISATALGVILVLIILQIVMRAVVNRGFPWTNEVSMYLLVWAVCLGIATAFYDRNHLAVDLVLPRLGRFRKPVEILAAVVTAIFLALLIWYGWAMVQNGMAQRSPSLGLPMGYVYLALPVAGVLSLFNLVGAQVIGKQPQSEVEAP